MKGNWGSRYAIAASTLALLFALGGTAYAVNTVRSSDIVNGTIRTEDIGTGAVQSIDIKNSTVGVADLAPGTLGRTPAAMARVDGNGESFLINRGLSSITRNSTGSYTIQAGRSVTNCLYVVTPQVADQRAAANEASTTAVNVYIYDDTGPINTTFDIVLFC